MQAAVEVAPEVRAKYTETADGLNELTALPEQLGVRLIRPIVFRLFGIGSHRLAQAADIGIGSTGATTEEAVDNLAEALTEQFHALRNYVGNNPAIFGRAYWFRNTMIEHSRLAK